MIISIEQIIKEQKQTGFKPEIIEKVILLMDLLNEIMSDSFLKDKLALKGGTALNFFHLNFPRLSIDIDLNYVGSRERQKMLSDRERLEAILTGLFQRKGFSIRRYPTEYAGGKIQLGYDSALNQTAQLEVDLNYLSRVPILPIEVADSFKFGSYQAKSIPILDIHELTAGKLTALFSRHAGRDLFDTHQLLTKSTNFDGKLLRLAFVVYGSASRKDWRTISSNDIAYTSLELQNLLVPVLPQEKLFEVKSVNNWAGIMVEECQKAINDRLLPFSDSEKEFLDRLLDHAEIVPELLTNDPVLIENIKDNPGIKWKALNVKKHTKS